jgi:hypothetical protein
MRILTIGNSFSEDATRYLHQIAKAQGKNLEVVNLVIGGCSLEMHYRNMLGNAKSYMLFFNGEFTGFYTTMEEALLSRTFDAISLQQCSHFAGVKETYSPYLSELIDYLRTYQPKAKIYFHQTWGYEDGCSRLSELTAFSSMEEMTIAVRDTVSAALEEEDLDGAIPSGEMMLALTKLGIEKIHRDTFHADCGIGRYALGLLWFRVLTGESVTENTFRDLDVPAKEEDFAIVKAYVEKQTPLA